MHPHHQSGRFIVPRRDDSPDVGEHARAYVESIQDEVAEIAASHASHFYPVGSKANPHDLRRFGMAVVAMLGAREDGSTHADSMAQAAAKYERILAWLSEAHDTVQMGLRTFAMLYTLRPDLTGGATLAAIGRQSRRTRAAVDKYIVEFRDTFGVQSPNAKSDHTRKLCKKAQLSRRR